MRFASLSRFTRRAFARFSFLVVAGAVASSVCADVLLDTSPEPVATLFTAQDAGDGYESAYARWRTSLDSFAEKDGARPPASNGILFVGSSTIRLWSNLHQDFRQAPVVINRGFGGSTMRDCNALARELVIQYRPKEILVYAGDNDLAEGRTPAEVVASFARFVRRVRAELPNARIAYISIKPSPARAGLLERIRETNASIAAYVKTVPGVRYIDVFRHMLGADGHPRHDLFQSDRLHLNGAGYRLWQRVIAADLFADPKPVAARHRPAGADRR